MTGPDDNLAVFASGNGGQRLTVQPKADVVVASFSGRYNDKDAWRPPLKILLDFAYPEARKRLKKN